MEIKKQEHTNEICDKCFNYVDDKGPYEVQGNYVCFTCYENFIQWLEMKAEGDR